MHEMSETAKALHAELLQMADRKREIERIVNTLVWPDGIVVEDEVERSKLDNLNFYDFEYWRPSSHHC